MKNAFQKSVTALAVAASLSIITPSHAASNTQGGLVGQAVNDVGQIISQASVTVRNLDTGLTRTVTTDDKGIYRFPLLPAGDYEVFAEKQSLGESNHQKVKIRIGQNASLNLSFSDEEIEVIEIAGGSITMIDTKSSESVMIMDSATIERLPVARDVTSVALLAPGVTQGDSAFEGDSKLASFSGSSVGENAYYINGLNTTNFRNGLGGSQVPFEFYEQFEVKSGGYGAEYGRSTGGVVTAITKSGGNTTKFGFSAYYEPDALSEDKPNVFNAAGEEVQIGDQDEKDEYDFNVYSSGAIIKDELFYYVLLNPRSQNKKYNSSTLGSTNYYERDQSSLFWGLNLDWYINDNNIVEFTAFSDKREEDLITSTWDRATNTIVDDSSAKSLEERGGDNYALKYTSIITDDLQVSALVGLNRYDRTDSSEFDTTCPWVYDSRDGGLTKMGCWATANTVTADDERKALRIDVDYNIGDHALRFGLDFESNTINNIEQYSGGRYYRYFTAGEGGAFNGQLAEGEEYYRLIERTSNGSFDTDTTALYFQDTWQATDNLVLTLGVRNETFDNMNIEGDSFIKVTNQWAPRIGASWDVNGDGETKVYAHLGRYYLPVAANTNLRLAGAELYTRRYFKLDGLTADSTPTNDYYDDITGTTNDHPNQIGATTVYDDGIVADTSSIVDANIKPMYQDELIVGFQHQLNDDWTIGVRGTYRDLATSIEDIAIDAGLQRYADENSGVDLELGGFDYYVLTNPGNDMQITVDADGDGELDNITLTAEQLGYPEAQRQYAALDFMFERAWDGKWMLQGSYTWSHSWGNSEGAVRSDNGQDDSGLTTNFDQPGLTDGAYGNLPNDRRHQVKLFGGYSITENLTFGANFSWQTGRPLNAFGYHPTDDFAQAYGSESFYKNGQLVPRGSLGNQPSFWSMDLAAKYAMEIQGADVVFALDVFNVFNNDTVRQTYEIADSEDSGHFEGVGTHPTDEYFGLADNHQTPRYVRLSATVRF
ncbi:TonB-dependent receptor [Flocculibacter collagenilyticus]|uniref:TonB-dependent receptor n=1 Tax=Flocculibacter collagenilyticus TaxID=2744479 RepID=UPI0018F67B4F|nr:TonB-dependent receptor [Flocculibacter collagenilyticus]